MIVRRNYYRGRCLTNRQTLIPKAVTLILFNVSTRNEEGSLFVARQTKQQSTLYLNS